MSHKENDKYLEQLATLELDIHDDQEAFDRATYDLVEAVKWIKTTQENLHNSQKRLNDFLRASEGISISDVVKMESEMDDDSDKVAEERSNEDFNQIQDQQRHE